MALKPNPVLYILFALFLLQSCSNNSTFLKLPNVSKMSKVYVDRRFDLNIDKVEDARKIDNPRVIGIMKKDEDSLSLLSTQFMPAYFKKAFSDLICNNAGVSTDSVDIKINKIDIFVDKDKERAKYNFSFLFTLRDKNGNILDLTIGDSSEYMPLWNISLDNMIRRSLTYMANDFAKRLSSTDTIVTDTVVAGKIYKVNDNIPSPISKKQKEINNAFSMRFKTGQRYDGVRTEYQNIRHLENSTSEISVGAGLYLNWYDTGKTLEGIYGVTGSLGYKHDLSKLSNNFCLISTLVFGFSPFDIEKNSKHNAFVSGEFNLGYEIGDVVIILGMEHTLISNMKSSTGLSVGGRFGF